MITAFDLGIAVRGAVNHQARQPPLVNRRSSVNRLTGWRGRAVRIGLRPPPSSLSNFEHRGESLEFGACARFAIERGPGERLSPPDMRESAELRRMKRW